LPGKVAGYYSCKSCDKIRLTKKEVGLSMSDYKFDRSTFKMQTFNEADSANVFEKSGPYSERLPQAYYLISQAYGFSMSEQPKLDRHTFSSRKLDALG
jgi:hypothetical protein